MALLEQEEDVLFCILLEDAIAADQTRQRLLQHGLSLVHVLRVEEQRLDCIILLLRRTIYRGAALLTSNLVSLPVHFTDACHFLLQFWAILLSQIIHVLCKALVEYFQIVSDLIWQIVDDFFKMVTGFDLFLWRLLFSPRYSLLSTQLVHLFGAD